MNTELLKTLCEIPAVSGHEDKLIHYVVKYLKGCGSEVHTDKLGNVSATFAGTGETPASLAYFAHLDEIGLIVRKIEDNGFLRVERIGGVPERALTSLQVDVHSLDGDFSCKGVFGIISHHITPPDKKYVVTSVKDLYIDIGANDKNAVLEKGIDIGSTVTYKNNFTVTEDKVFSKALDDRTGVYSLLEMAVYLKDNRQSSTIHLIFSVQEEFCIRACTPTFNRLAPDAAICVDITPSCDTPDTEGAYDMKLGKGPAVTYMNFHGRGTLGGLLPNPKLNRLIEKTAKECGISVQKEVIMGVITDDAFTQHTGTEGIPMAHISIPLRYTHSPVEAANIQDIDAAAHLLLEVGKRFDKGTDLNRGI